MTRNAAARGAAEVGTLVLTRLIALGQEGRCARGLAEVLLAGAAVSHGCCWQRYG